MKDSEKESRSKLTLGSVERKEKQPRAKSGYVPSEKSFRLWDSLNYKYWEKLWEKLNHKGCWNE